MQNWMELRTAYQVAKLGTVSAAARALNVHRATVNRHIDILETELGVPIFIRNPKGYALTDFGEELLKVAQKTDQLFDDLVGRAKARDGTLEGEIKITSLLPLISVLMTPIAAFRAEHPHCQVTITSTEDLQRLEYGEAHIAVRAGSKPEHPDYVVQSLGATQLNLYAHIDYLSQYDAPVRAADLAHHMFVMPPKNERLFPIWSWIYEHVADPRVAIQANDQIVVRDAVLAGLGLGVLGAFDVAGHQDLRPVLPSHGDWAVPLWLVTHVDLHRTEKVQEMLKHIKAARW